MLLLEVCGRYLHCKFNVSLLSHQNSCITKQLHLCYLSYLFFLYHIKTVASFLSILFYNINKCPLFISDLGTLIRLVLNLINAY